MWTAVSTAPVTCLVTVDEDSFIHLLHCALAAAQCIVIGPVCLWVGVHVCVRVCGWVCYHDNSELRTSILTKLGL